MTAQTDAHIEWSALAEPGDREAGWLVAQCGAVGALAWLDVVAVDPVTATMQLAALADQASVEQVVKASERWLRRRPRAQADDLRERARRCGTRPVVPGDPDWPAMFDDLGMLAPRALWVRGTAPLRSVMERTVAVVGARSATSYGEHVAATMAADLADAGWTVVSGGAYGIDIAAHRGTLAAGGATVAVMAGGVDRLYPAGNQMVLERVLDTGIVMSETPPGWAPHRQRFLDRNRLIACANATVVVEAAYRSGALSTAAHAERLLRPVGAVPGPVSSAASAGCHRLIREAGAVLVTGAADVLELAGPLEVTSTREVVEGTDAGPHFDSPQDRAVYDAMGRRNAEVEDLAGVAGLTVAEVRAGLGRLELSGAVVLDGGRWRRVKRGT